MNVVRGGLVDLNWTFVGPYLEDPLPASHPTPEAWPAHRPLLVDVTGRTAAVLWSSDEGQGASILTLADGLVVHEWTVPAARAFAY